MTEQYIKLVDGVEVPMTAEEIAERQAEENAPPPPASQIDQLKTMFTLLPVEAQAQFGPLAAAVFMFLGQSNPDAARLVILNAVVPDELVEIKNNMLAVFDV